MSEFRSRDDWLSAAPSPRTAEIRQKVRMLEGEIVDLKRHRAVAGNIGEIDVEIDRAKKSIGRIRAHLKRGVYG